MIVTLDQAKANLNVTFEDDDALIAEKISAAQDHVERLLGFRSADEFPATDDDEYPATVPASLKQAVMMVAAHFYENREAALVGVNAQDLPLGVWSIVNEFRNWSW